MIDAGERIGAAALGNAHALACVTFGVTWGKQGSRFGIIIEPEVARGEACDIEGEARDIERREPRDLRQPSWKFRGNHLSAGKAPGA